MAYDTDELKKTALEVINSKKLIFIEEVAVMMGINKTTFYAHKLNENDAIKEAILENKINIKNGLRAKWYNNDNATTQVALYKLAATDAEFERLAGQKIDATNLNKNVDMNMTDFTDEQLNKIAGMSANELDNLAKGTDKK